MTTKGHCGHPWGFSPATRPQSQLSYYNWAILLVLSLQLLLSRKQDLNSQTQYLVLATGQHYGDSIFYYHSSIALSIWVWYRIYPDNSQTFLQGTSCNLQDLYKIVPNPYAPSSLQPPPFFLYKIIEWNLCSIKIKKLKLILLSLEFHPSVSILIYTDSSGRGLAERWRPVSEGKLVFYLDYTKYEKY